MYPCPCLPCTRRQGHRYMPMPPRPGPTRFAVVKFGLATRAHPGRPAASVHQGSEGDRERERPRRGAADLSRWLNRDITRTPRRPIANAHRAAVGLRNRAGATRLPASRDRSVARDLRARGLRRTNPDPHAADPRRRRGRSSTLATRRRFSSCCSSSPTGCPLHDAATARVNPAHIAYFFVDSTPARPVSFPVTRRGLLGRRTFRTDRVNSR